MVKQNKYKKTNPKWQLRVGLRLSPEGPIVAHEDVKDSDLSDHYSEVWREGCLRKGYMNVSLQDLAFHLEPIIENVSDDQVCKGFIIETTNPGYYQIRKGFSIYSLNLVALRAARRLIQGKILKQGDQFHYNIFASYYKNTSLKIKGERSTNCLQNCTIKEKQKHPLAYVKLPLAPLLKIAKAMNMEDDSYPVFYTHSAYKKADAISRKGADLQPTVETGALLLGILCSCPKTKEFFVIIKDVFELYDVEKKTYSLTLTGSTWMCIQNLLRNLRSNTKTCSYSIVGQCHGHNFLPEISKNSDNLQNCVISSVFVSMADRMWNSAVFHQEPCQLCHIFGLDLSGEKSNSLFGLKDGRLLQRKYYLIPDCELESIYNKVKDEVGYQRR